MPSKIPTSLELEEAANRVMAEVGYETKRDWLHHPCTEAVICLLECARMQALEVAEEGPEPHVMAQHIAQAQLAKNLTEDLMKYIMDDEEIENDD